MPFTQASKRRIKPDMPTLKNSPPVIENHTTQDTLNSPSLQKVTAGEK
jgi:hypothetical protein